jgi:phytoene desaturase
MHYSMSLFLIYFGTRNKYPDLLHHNVIFGARYRELLADIFDKGNLADDFSLYLHAPTYSDPSLAPPGCQAFYVLSPVPHLGKLSIDWGAEGPRYAERILDYLERHYMPGLKGDLVTRRIFTPEDFRTELNSHFGSAFSLEPRLSQSAYFRIHNRDSSLRGLYFVGAGTHPGAGIPGVVNSAKATAGVIFQDFRGVIEPNERRYLYG